MSDASTAAADPTATSTIEMQTLEAENALIIGLLRTIEWQGAQVTSPTHRLVGSCPSCKAHAEAGHEDDCALQAAIEAHPS